VPAAAEVPALRNFHGATVLTERYLALRIRNLTRGTVLTENADAADTSQKRRTGLLKHSGLADGEGLWIVPCEGVHTFGMNFTIDVVFLNKKRVVLKTRKEMGKRRLAFCLRAHSVLELPAGMIAKTKTEPGDQLEFEKR
jgi:uncharacterized membrane protein (UPF0127 family)